MFPSTGIVCVYRARVWTQHNTHTRMHSCTQAGFLGSVIRWWDIKNWAHGAHLILSPGYAFLVGDSGQVYVSISKMRILL